MKKRNIILSLFIMLILLVLASCGNKHKEIDRPKADDTTYYYTGTEITYNIEESDFYTISNNKQTNAGSYKVVVSLKDKKKYTWVTTKNSEDLTYDFIINSKKIDKPTVGTSSFAYTGEEITLDIPSSNFYTVSNNKKTDIGNYEATVSLNDKNNYVWSDNTTADLKFSYSIVENNISTSTVSGINASYEYTGNEINPSLVVTFNETVLVQNQDYTVSYQNNTNVGEATVTISGTGKYNGSKVLHFNIVKATPSITAPSAINNLVYNGNEQVLINAATTSAGTIQYKLDNGNYSSDLPKATNAGTYKVYYKVVGNDNINDVAEKSIDVTIAKATPSVTAPTALNNLVYTGEEQTLINAATTNAGTIQYKLDNGNYSSDSPKATNAGTYKVYYKVVGNDNINDVAEKSIDVTIAKAVVSNATIELDNNEYTYTESAITPTTAITFNNLTLTVNTDYTLEYSNNINVGTATITITFIGNYTGSATKTFEIIAATINKPAADTTVYTYNNNEQAYNIAENSKYTITNNKKTTAGTYTVTVSLVDKVNYTWDDASTDDLTFEFIINTLDVSSLATVANISNQTYTGLEIKPNVNISWNNNQLTKGTDYTLAYSNNIEIGTATITITFIGNYTGSTTKTFEIVASGIVTKPEADTTVYTYNGNEQTYNIPENSKYTITNNKKTNAGTYTVTVSLVDKVNYTWDDASTDDLTFEFIINTLDVSSLATVANISNQTYTGLEIKPNVNISWNNNQLTKGTDYTLAYSNNIEIGTATTTITFIGNYTGSTTKTFEIVELAIDDESITVLAQTKTFTGNEIKDVNLTIINTNTNTQLILDIDYIIIEYSNNINAGSGTITINGKGAYKGTRTITFTISKANITSTVLENDISDQVYTGSEITPSFTLLLNTYSLVSNTDYTVTYSNNVDIGTATITVTGINNFAGTKVFSFKIITNVQTYTITFNTNGGTSVSNTTYTSTENQNDISLPITSKPGYNFVGWIGIDGDNTYAKIPAGTCSNLELTASFEAIVYSISYDLNGGAVVQTNPTSYTIETPSFTLNNPTKDGYTFTGWKNSTTTIQNITISIGTYGDLSYEAIWEPINYTITYNLNGGAVAQANPNTYNIETTPFTLNNPTKDGYTFAGWTGSNGNTPNTTIEITQSTTGDLSYEAIWSIINYSISYTLNGGSVVTANPNTYTIQTNAFTLNNPTKDGYTFTGWTGSNGDTPSTSVMIIKGTTGDLAYVANWTLTSYTINYVLDGGSVAQANPNAYNINTESFTLNNPTKDGFTFIGWTGSNGSTPVATITITKGSTGDLTYVARWSIDSYTITYNLDGGSVTQTNPTTYNINTESFTLNNPTKNGSTFAGWTGSNGNTPATTVTISQGSMGDLAYVANWTTVEYTITYTLNDGSVAQANPVKYTIETETFTLINPTKANYTFAGWTGSNGNTPATTVTISQGTTGDLTYVANWTAVEYTITYTLNSGSVTQANPNSYNIETATFSLNNPTRNGYEFTGWTGSNGDTPATTVTITQGSTGNLAYTANWQIETYTITFNSNGGSTVNSITYDITTNTFDLPLSTKDGYSMIWKNGNTSISKITKGEYYSNINLVAEWTPIDYTISYYLGDGTVAQTNPDTYNIETETFTLNNPTKTNYTFVGWTGSNGDTPAMTVTITQGSTGDLSYTANWTTVEYTISYDLDGGSVTSSNPTKYTIETNTFTLNNPTKNGYTFTGWTGSGLDNATTTVTIEKGTIGNLSFVATWTLATYTITFNANGGSAVADITYTINTDTFTLPLSTRTGYTMHWDNGGSAISQITKGSYYSDLALTAVWSAIEYNITYDLDGGSSSSNPGKYTIESQIDLYSPYKKGYTFTGWTGSNGNTPSTTVTISQGTTGDLSYTAHWQKNVYQISYELNGGTVATANPTTYSVDTPSFTLNNPAKSGYTFDGWTSNLSQTKTQTVTITVGSTGNLTFTANWTIQTYTITYNLDGGTNSTNNPASFDKNTDSFTLENPTKSGYTFVKWEMNSNAITTITPSSMLYDITLDAIFIECPLTIGSFDSNVGSFAVYEGTTLLGTTTINNKVTLENSYIGQVLTFKAVINDSTYVYEGIFDLDTSTSKSADYEYQITLAENTDTMTLAPQWFAYNITINQIANPGDSEASMPNTNYTKVGGEKINDQVTYTASIPSGYVWAGWYNGDTLIDSSLGLTITPTVTKTAQTFRACWYDLDSLLTIEAPGVGASHISVSDNLVLNSNITLTANAVENYSFVKWYKDTVEVGTNATYTFQLTKTPVTISAEYVKDNISILKYYLNSSSVATLVDSNYNYGGYIDSKVVDSDNTTITFASYDGFTLTSLTKQGTSTNITINNNVAVIPNPQNTEVYEAIWTPNTYTITYNLDGGTNNANNLATYNIFSGTFTIYNPTKTDSTFTGWTGSNGSTPQIGFSVVAEDNLCNLTYSANWAGAEYTYTFYPTNGQESFILTSFSGVAFDNIQGYNEPENGEYTFDGWYSNMDLSGSALTTTPAGNTSLYACWAEETKPCVFDIDDGYIINGLAGNAPSNIVFPAYIGENKVVINMNYDWGSDYTLPSNLSSIIFGYYQTSQANISFDGTTFNQIDEDYNYYTYNNHIYYLDDNDELWLCEELRWIVISNDNGKYTLISTTVIDERLATQGNLSVNEINTENTRKVAEIENALKLITSNASIKASLPTTTQINNLDSTSKQALASDYLTMDPVNYCCAKAINIPYYNSEGTQKGTSSNISFGIRPVITVTF